MQWLCIDNSNVLLRNDPDQLQVTIPSIMNSYHSLTKTQAYCIANFNHALRFMTMKNNKYNIYIAKCRIILRNLLFNTITEILSDHIKS